MVMFISGFLIGVVILFSFILGTVSQRIVCDPLKDPENSQVFDLINKVNFSNYHINFKISQALENCNNNQSIYQVFNLSSQFNLEEVKHYMDKFEINETLGSLMDQIGAIDQNFTLLSADQKQLLSDLAQSNFADVNLDQFQDLVIFLYYYLFWL